MISLYITAFFLIFIEVSILNTKFIFNCIFWDPLSILIILTALYAKNNKNVYIFTAVVSTIQDIFTLGYGINFVSKIILVFLVHLVKEKFFISSFFVKSIMVIILSLSELALRFIYSFIFLGQAEICSGYIFYILLNFTVFYIYYLLKESR